MLAVTAAEIPALFRRFDGTTENRRLGRADTPVSMVVALVHRAVLRSFPSCDTDQYFIVTKACPLDFVF